MELLGEVKNWLIETVSYKKVQKGFQEKNRQFYQAKNGEFIILALTM